LYYYIRQENGNNEVLDDQTDSNVHINEYCLHPTDKMSALTPHFANLRATNFTFKKLPHLNITVEQYKLFVDNMILNNSSSNEIFYSYTRPWFDSLRQYTFDYRIGMEFIDVVRGMFENKLDANNEIDR